ncbi:hypothetical protein TRFO_09133 [Tritrichomonas foetus]|uniref:Translation initiation factor IF2/IF5 domain-containing protein n=1 Tax=Tritrichomonas foetus TaxID=1144522 RepID=A0A1J4JL38_9EUKA|nr:hypothetical protein TRFO_09133 [Tritrichomonas foetus]|eukprot:OHS97980.1 hypothetical protein TRFO_09133 [Tritrichomonas foetus]
MQPTSGQRIPIKKGEDPNTYRYMMPRVSIRHSGNITTITNISEIAKEIGRSASCLRQWLMALLGLTTRIDPKNANDLQIKGHHEASSIQDSIYEFINVFVICPCCGNPETTMFVQNSELNLQCRACGRSSPAGGPSGGARGKSKQAQKAVQKETTWILKHIHSENLQSHSLQSDAAVENLDDFEVPGPDMF